MIDYTAVKRTPEYLDVSDIKRKSMGLYYPAPDRSLRKFDIYYPDTGKGPFPVIVNIAGGGWYFGHPTSVHLGRQIHTAVGRGYAFVSIACTGSGSKKFPYQLHEIFNCLRYLNQNRDKLHLDMSFLSLQGASSGGHLALLSSLVRGKPYYDIPDAPPAPEIHAVNAIYPCCRLNATVEDYHAIGLEPDNLRSGPKCAESILLGVENVHDAAELIDIGSPLFQLHPKAPPVLLLHGTKDTCIPYTQSLEFAARYRQIAGTEKIQTYFIRGAAHSDPRFKDDTMCNKIIDFFDRVRNGETPCPPHLQNKDF